MSLAARVNVRIDRLKQTKKLNVHAKVHVISVIIYKG